MKKVAYSKLSIKNVNGLHVDKKKIVPYYDYFIVYEILVEIAEKKNICMFVVCKKEKKKIYNFLLFLFNRCMQ